MEEMPTHVHFTEGDILPLFSNVVGLGCLDQIRREGHVGYFKHSTEVRFQSFFECLESLISGWELLNVCPELFRGGLCAVFLPLVGPNYDHGRT